MRSQVPEKRREVREQADGVVEIFCEDGSPPAAVSGRLVDISRSGFRAAHGGAALTKGQTVRFRHATAAGTARVVWNRITGEVTETGFVVL